jgi:hypothetical protein
MFEKDWIRKLDEIVMRCGWKLEEESPKLAGFTSLKSITCHSLPPECPNDLSTVQHVSW